MAFSRNAAWSFCVISWVSSCRIWFSIWWRLSLALFCSSTRTALSWPCRRTISFSKSACFSLALYRSSSTTRCSPRSFSAKAAFNWIMACSFFINSPSASSRFSLATLSSCCLSNAISSSFLPNSAAFCPIRSSKAFCAFNLSTSMTACCLRSISRMRCSTSRWSSEFLT